MKIWNVNVKRGADGSKHLDIQMHGYIDDGWSDDGIDSADVVSELNQHLDAKTVQVRINSGGGSAFGGVAMYNALQAHPGEVTCCVEGLAASAASLVAMAGKTVMGKGAMMMIHPPLTVAMGNAEQFRKTADVLDKVQDALAEIYKSKTGKSLDEINDLLDAETWMNGDEAVAAGFADEVMPDVKTAYGPGEQVPAEQENRGPQLTADGAGVIWNGVTFPVAKVPWKKIIDMVLPPVQTSAAPPPTPPTPAAPAAVLAIVPPEPAQPTAVVASLQQRALTRQVLAEQAPELLAVVLEEGRAAGVAAERARLQAIDELGVTGCAELVAAAKYGEKPTDAAALAMAVVKAGKVAGSELLALRRQESTPLVAIATGAPDQTAAAAEARIIAAIVAGGNARRGGNP